jgi:hypothetical protein
MYVDSQSDHERSESPAYSSNARVVNHWGNPNDDEIRNQINKACKTPVSSDTSNDGGSDVSEMELLPPVDS